MRDYLQKSPVNSMLIIANVLYFTVLFLMGDPGTDTEMMIRRGALACPLVLSGEYYRLLTSAFMHFSARHLANNMIVLYAVGEKLESAMGHVKYLVFYICSAVLAGSCSFLYHLSAAELYTVCAGASGAVFGVTGGLLYVLIRNNGRIPGLGSRQLCLMLILNIYLGFSEGGVDNAAHIGGLVSGFLLSILMYRRPESPEVL